MGDEITCVVAAFGDLGPMGVMPRTKKFRVAAIFFSGMYEFDAGDVYVTLEEAQGYFNTDDKVTMVDLKSEDAERVDTVTDLANRRSRLSPVSFCDLRAACATGKAAEITRTSSSAEARAVRDVHASSSIAILVASFCDHPYAAARYGDEKRCCEIAILKAVGASDTAILRTCC